MSQRKSSSCAPVIQRVVHLTEATSPELIDGLRQRLVEADESRRSSLPVTLVEICRGPATYCLTIDRRWLDFAADVRQISPASLNELEVPPISVVAILDGPYDDWLDVDWGHTEYRRRSDGVVIVSQFGERGTK